MTITYGELPETAGPRFICCANPDCEEFQNGYSATRGDYFATPPGAVVRCGVCAEPMILARERCTIEEVSQ